MKKILLFSAAIIFTITIGLQTPYVVRSSEVFCRTSPPQSEHCMLIKRTSSSDISIRPLFGSAGSARFFAFEVDIGSKKIVSDFSLYAYLGHKEDGNEKSTVIVSSS